MPHDHATYREWLYLERDGGLEPRERRELRRHVAGCAPCEREAHEAARLQELLAASRVEVRPDFNAEVMAGLAPAGWEARHPRSWVAAAALFALFVGGAMAATLLGGPQPAGPWIAALGAVADLFENAALAGAGLLAASWQGLGGAVRDALGGSPLPLAVFGLLILGLDVLFVRLLLRGRARRRAVAERRPER